MKSKGINSMKPIPALLTSFVATVLAMPTFAAQSEVVYPLYAQAAAAPAVHGVELKKAHRVVINGAKTLSGGRVQVKATLTYADDTVAKCTYVMAASILKQDAGAGIWLAPYPAGEKCVDVK